MAKNEGLTTKELINYLESQGCAKDADGNYFYSKGYKFFRFRILKTSVVYESAISTPATEAGKSKLQWTRRRSGLLKNISISPSNGLKGMNKIPRK